MKVYVFHAALLCELCGLAAITALERTTGKPPIDMREDSDIWPQGPYGQGGGEADCPQHCDHCHLFLENMLTTDGVEYVKDAAAAYEIAGSDESWDEVAERASQDGMPVLAEWIRYYFAPGM